MLVIEPEIEGEPAVPLLSGLKRHVKVDSPRRDWGFAESCGYEQRRFAVDPGDVGLGADGVSIDCCVGLAPFASAIGGTVV